MLFQTASVYILRVEGNLCRHWLAGPWQRFACTSRIVSLCGRKIYGAHLLTPYFSSVARMSDGLIICEVPNACLALWRGQHPMHNEFPPPKKEKKREKQRSKCYTWRPHTLQMLFFPHGAVPILEDFELVKICRSTPRRSHQHED